MKTLLVTISGTHGTGKTTQVGRCYYLLNRSGHKFSYLTHQDLIDPFGFVVRRSARILGFDRTDEFEKLAPVRVFWSIYLLLIYFPFLVLGIKFRRLFGISVVTDRYLYDLLVAFWDNGTKMPLEGLLLRLIPRPDICFVFDTDARRILSARPEHTLEFIETEKQYYDMIAKFFGLEKIVTAEPPSSVWEYISSKIKLALNDGLLKQ